MTPAEQVAAEVARVLAGLVSRDGLADFELAVRADLHRVGPADPRPRQALIDALSAERGRSGARSGHFGGASAGVLVSIDIASRTAGVPARTVRRWAKDERVTSTKSGREWRVSLVQVQALAEENRS